MEIDDHLARLGAVPLPDLSGIDGAVLAERMRIETRRGRAALGAAMVFALGIGMVGGMEEEPQTETALVAFGPAPALTPLIVLGQP